MYIYKYIPYLLHPLPRRDIYYEDVSLWTSQIELDLAVTRLTRILNVPRHLLNIYATAKGLVFGSLRYVDAGQRTVDCNTSTGIDIRIDIIIQ